VKSSILRVFYHLTLGIVRYNGVLFGVISDSLVTVRCHCHQSPRALNTALGAGLHLKRHRNRDRMGCLENGTDYVPPASHIVQANLVAKNSGNLSDCTLPPTARAPMLNLTHALALMRGLLVSH
jgi:hypothetical protein